MTKSKDTVEVQATGPIRHGDGETVTEYAAGDTFSVTMAQAKQLVDAGAVEQPKKAAKGGKASKTDADLAAEKKAADEAAIAEANAKAEAERKAAADTDAAARN